jgi:alpha-aminoadipate carrier protein LysW
MRGVSNGRAPDGLTRESMANCPECDAEIEVDEFDVDKGDQLSCPECGSNLEVTSVSPIELDFAPEDDDDEDLDDDDDDADLEDDEIDDEDEEDDETDE